MRGSRWTGLLTALFLLTSGCADEAEEQAAREQAVHAVLGSIREETVTAMFYAAQDEWDRPGVFRTATAIQAMRAAGETAQRIMEPATKASEVGCESITVQQGVSSSSDLGLLTATPGREERELKNLVVKSFDGLFDAIPTKPGTGYGGSAEATFHWYVVVIGRDCPAAPSIGETFDTWSESIEVEVPEPPPGTGFE